MHITLIQRHQYLWQDRNSFELDGALLFLPRALTFLLLCLDVFLYFAAHENTTGGFDGAWLTIILRTIC